MRAPHNHNRRLTVFARKNRHESTDAERKLWTLLRNRTLAGFKFRRQVPVGRYILDFYCIRHKLAIELDGGQHLDPRNLKYDATRTHQLFEFGIRVLRFNDREVLQTPLVVSNEILRHLDRPSPSPDVPREKTKHRLRHSTKPQPQ
jgi:very-short-patch-repair endonuclease